MAPMLTALASAVIVLTGVGALLKSVWKIAQTIKDNTVATKQLSEKLEGFSAVVDGRITDLDHRVLELERHINRS